MEICDWSLKNLFQVKFRYTWFSNFLKIVLFLGRRGGYTFSSGLTIAYLGGLEKGSDNVSDPDVRFAPVDVDNVRLPFTSNKDFKGIDVLLTSQWPLGVEKYGNNIVSLCFNGFKLWLHWQYLCILGWKCLRWNANLDDYKISENNICWCFLNSCLFWIVV